MAKSKKSKVGAQEVTVDRRRKERRGSAERRSGDAERRQSAETAEAPEKEQRQGDRRALGERREKVQRRRQIDPTTCERDYTLDEIEFMQALDAYKRAAGRMFPTCSEILEVIRGMGYVKLSDLPAATDGEFGEDAAPLGAPLTAGDELAGPDLGVEV